MMPEVKFDKSTMRDIKPFLYIFTPPLCALLAGIYGWIIKYFFDSVGGDEFDRAQWTVAAVMTYGLFGFYIGLMIDLLIWLITFLSRKVNEQKRSF